MQKKNFQADALDTLGYWLDQIREQSKTHDMRDSLTLAWKRIFEACPNRTTKNYEPRQDVMGRDFPHACLKIPTGGGKTFTAVESLMIIMRKWQKSPRGLVLWIVHSKAIYDQTLKSLGSKESHLRQRLNYLSGDRLKILTKEKLFSQPDIEENLCLIVLMLPSAISGAHKEIRRIERMTGAYESFFPDPENILENKKFKEKHARKSNGENAGVKFEGGIPVTSLANAIRICRPVVIVDEAHRAGSEQSIPGINGLNPSIMLEISATPKGGNILYTASGREVWEEELIKLPVRIYHGINLSWKAILGKAIEKRDELEKTAENEYANGGKYVRPIAVIRAEYTGKDHIDRFIHAYTVKIYLRKVLNIHPDQIAIQSSSKKDLAGKNLLSESCPIRYIITKDALKEGWDCPFASVLAILGNFQATTGVTQLLGRVMRQPYGQRSKNKDLNLPYVFCSSNNTNTALSGIKTELEKHGYTGVKDLVQAAGDGGSRNVHEDRTKTQRRKKWKGCKIFFPKITFMDEGKAREFDYERDLMPLVDWNSLAYDKSFIIQSGKVSSGTQSDISDSGQTVTRKIRERLTDTEFDYVYLTEGLLDAVPNIFVAARIINDALKHHCKNHSFETVFVQRGELVEHIKMRLEKEITRMSRDVFDDMIKKGLLRVRFVQEFDSNESWEMPEFDFFQNEPTDIYDQKKYIFGKINTSSMNYGERNAAQHFEETGAIDWWFKATARSRTHGYFLQGWKKHRMWPDFLLALRPDEGGVRKYMIIEAKGVHLMGNLDTTYKRDLMQVVEDAAFGQSKPNKTHYFRVIDEGEWTNTFNRLLYEAETPPATA